jgi:hypothetical protein
MGSKKDMSFGELLKLHSEEEEVDSVDPFFFIDSGPSEYKIKNKCQFCNTVRYSRNNILEICQCEESILHQQKLIERQKIFDANRRNEDPAIRFKEARMKNKSSVYRKIK